MLERSYPELIIDQSKLCVNVKVVTDLCKKEEIQVAGVIKGTNGDLIVAQCMIDGGCRQIASSRIDQLKSMKQVNPSIETMLLRIPMQSELEEVLLWSDISLNSEIETVKWLERLGEKHQKSHRVVLMADLGDLREGFFNHEELIETAKKMESEMKWVKLVGIGTNLGCYGAIKPTVKNLGQLCALAEEIERTIGRKLDIVSGGATSSLPLLLEGKMPKGINHLRIGEGILLNMDLPDIWGVHIDHLTRDIFVVNAQIIEIKTKPSYPVGEIFIDAFGETPVYEDRGTRKRAILALGKQDFAIESHLLPLDKGASIIGSSSDHLMMDIEDCDETYKVGDTMSFATYYGAMLHLCSSNHVSKRYV